MEAVFGADQASGAWESASRGEPCPICGKPDWCRVTGDRRAVLCKRSDGTAPAGWRAVKSAKGGGHVLARIDPLADDHAVLERVRTPKMPAGHKLTTERCAEILASGRGPGWRTYLEQLAEQLRVSPDVLEHLGVGWRWGDVDRGRPLHEGDWIYPMRDGSGQVVGVHRRLAVPFKQAGKLVGKLMVQGSRLGLIYAPELWQRGSGPILMPEGMTDTAAIMHIGQASVGRPSDRGGIDELTELLRGVPESRPLLVLGENDRKADGRWPGRDGAQATAQRLADALQRPVGWAMVPEPAKDAREHITLALEAGIDPADVGRSLVAELLERATLMHPAPRDPVLDGRAPAGATVAMDDLRAQMRARMMQLAAPPLLMRLRPDDEHPEGEPKLHPGIYLCQAGTGVGKSRAALELVLELERLGLRVAYLSQTHRQSAERLQEAEALGLAGGAADPEITPQTCELWGAAKRVRACGLSVQQVLCPACPLRDRCLFQQQKAQAKAAPVRFACHAMAGQDLAKVAAGRDALVIDEDAIGAAVRQVRARPKHLLHVLRVLRSAAKAYAKLVDDDTRQLLELMTSATEALLRAVRQSSQAGAVRIDTSGLAAPPMQCACGDLVGRKHAGQTCDRCGTEVPGDVQWSAKVWRLLGHKGQKLPPTDAMQLLLDVITGRITEVWTCHNLQATGAWDRELVGYQRHKIPRKLVLLLDATADRATLERVISASGTTWTNRMMSAVQTITPDGRAADVHLARRMVPAGGDVLVGSTAERATEALRGLLGRVPGERLGLICHGQHLVPMFGQDLEGGGLLDDAELARITRVAGHHTADVRGSNSWMGGEGRERLDGLMVLGCPNVPWAEVRLRLLATGNLEAASMADGGWLRHQVLGTTPEGEEVSNPAMGHTDHAWQEARRQLVHAALLQDAGRARHTLPDGCPVYVLTSEPMPGMLTDDRPVHGIDAQTHYLLQEVARLMEHAEGPENGPAGSTRARVKSHKEYYVFRENDPWNGPSVSTSQLIAHLAGLGWSDSTAKRALHQAARSGALAQPERGRWVMPGQQRPEKPPGSSQAASKPTGPIEATQQRQQPAVIVTGPRTMEVRAQITPAVVIAATGPDAEASQVVMAEALEQISEQAGYLQHEVAQPIQPGPCAGPAASAAVDDAAVAWLAACTPDEFAAWQERAAIMQHDGGLQRRQAEAAALLQMFAAAQPTGAPRAGPGLHDVTQATPRAGPSWPSGPSDGHSSQHGMVVMGQLLPSSQ
jgi:hypothetical protein